MNTSQIASLAGLLLLPWLGSGCIHITDEIDLAYEPRGGREVLSGAAAIPVQIQIMDQRPVQTDVGKVINGFGGEIGEILSNQDVSTYIGGILRTELDARGFGTGDQVKVDGKLTTFYNRFKMGFWAGDSIADFALDVSVRQSDGTVLYSRNFTAQGIEPNIQVARGHNAKAALEKAAWNGVNELFQDPKFIAALYQAAGKEPPQ